MKNIYMIGNTHFDPVWLWRWEEAMTSIHATFRSALNLMKEDPDFIYSFATPPVFEWIKKIDPPMFEEIKERVAEGRWEICEGWWLQPDCFSGCGESYARQSLYGQLYLKENFGRFTDTVFNIDSFGHNSATPQILQKSHMDYYCMVRPESYHFEIESPYFNWVGKDGSCVKAFRAGQYSEVYNKDMRKTVAEAEEKMQDALCDELMVYGVTNHGGAPTRKAIADIHALDAEKPYDLKFSTVTGYFEAQGEPKATVEGEMITKDFGPYTNHHLIKKRNRIAEYALLNAEKAAVMAKHAMGVPYPKEKLTDGWKDVMFNQFHDILGGASIKDAYFDAFNQQGRAIFTANEIMHFSLLRITKQIKTPGKNPDNPWNLVVWNLNDTPYYGTIEGEIQWLHEFDAYSGELLLEDGDGNRYPCQKIIEKSVIPGFRSRFVFKAEIPAMGYKAFKVIQTMKDVAVVSDGKLQTIDTKAFEIEIDPKSGLLEKVTAKKTGKTFENLLKPMCFEDEGDTWCFQIDSYGKACEDFVLTELKVTEQGLCRTTVKASYRFRSSLLTLLYTFYEDEDYFDVSYTVNWNEPHKVLKLISDTGYSKLTVSSPFATEERGDCAYDMPMGEWLCMHGEEGGVSFLADSLFSYTKEGTRVGLSVLRSCIYGDLRLEELDGSVDYPIMEQGICEGRVRIVIHEGDMFERGIAPLAASFNNPPIVICEANHDGALAPCGSYGRLTAQTVSVSAVKESEVDESEIVRLFEYGGREQTAELSYFGKSLSIPMKPYEIKTVKITKDGFCEVFITEDM